jgi:5-methylcytosine-specific restriction protein A
MTKKNPSWTRDELILALDLYTRYNPSRIAKNHSEVIILSKILKKLPLHKKIPDRKRFRNPNSVYMKLQNFKGCDPNFKGIGLSHENKLEKTIWKEFSQDLGTLNKIAVAIKSLTKSSVIKSLNKSYEEEFGCSAGKLLFRLHKKYENRPKLIQKKKNRAHPLKFCNFI